MARLSVQHIELFITLPCRRRGEHIWTRLWPTSSQYTYNARSQCNRYRIKKTFSYKFRQIFRSGNMYFRSISTLFFCGVRAPKGPRYVLQWILNRYGDISTMHPLTAIFFFSVTMAQQAYQQISISRLSLYIITIIYLLCTNFKLKSLATSTSTYALLCLQYPSIRPCTKCISAKLQFAIRSVQYSQHHSRTGCRHHMVKLFPHT